tara:strand:+ start:1144 stop:1563 length:420 start_codon:yes stop_codon:yes gene_type:complete
MITFCRKCGIKNEFPVRSFKDLICSCGETLIKRKENHYLYECKECHFGQQVNWDNDEAECRNCCAAIIHPTKKRVWGRSKAGDKPAGLDPIHGGSGSKTTINLQQDELEYLEARASELGIRNKANIIRALIRLDAGLVN